VNIFISYSMKDRELVEKLAEEVRPQATPVYWDKDKEPGQEAWPMITDWIEKADLIVAVITDRAVSRAMAVGNEIGIAKEKGKIIIPLVGAGVDDKDLGCLQGVVHQRVDTDNPGEAIQAVQRTVLAHLQRKLARTAEVAVASGDIWIALLLMAGMVGLIWLATRE